MTCCRVLEVSRAGFYAHRAQAARARPIDPVEVQLKADFEASGRSYGTRRLVVGLRARGVRISRYKARKLMKKNGLRTTWRRKFMHTTDSKHDLPVADNLLDRNFSPEGPDQAWVADITYIRTRSGWVYLAVVLDLFSWAGPWPPT